MRWRLAALGAALLIAAVCIYQLAFLACASAKLLGYGYAFEVWRGPVVRSTVRIGSISTDVYSGRKSHFPVLVVHGVNEDGKNSPEIRSVAEGLAGSGYRVFVPELARMAHQNVTPQDIDDLSLVFKSTVSEGGTLCASYGCGPALVAASRPDIRDRVRFIVTFGAYFDFIKTLEFIVTSPPSPMAYSKWVYMAANLDLVTDDNDRTSLAAIADEREKLPPEEWRLGSETLGPAGRAMLLLFESRTGQEFDERLSAVPPLKDRITRLSPSNYFDGIRAPLVILHMKTDPSIPSSESVRLAEAARARGLVENLTILNMSGHTKAVWPEPGTRSAIAFYVPEGLKAIWAMKQIVHYT
jgi:hypothetical protein